MFNKHFRKNKHFSETGFRFRGVESSRLEYLTDAVFAFAITLLVIASEVPATYVELQASMYGFIGFIACVLLLFGLWSNHSQFFLRYGMQDNRTKTLNFLFLFVLLFYIYPLKYLFSYLGALLLMNFFGADGFNSEAFVLAYEKAKLSQLTIIQWKDLMLRFGIGLLLIYSIFALMHINALSKKGELELNEKEIVETKFHLFNYLYLCLVCLISMSLVLITGGRGSGISGMVYFMIPIGLAILNRLHKRRLKKKFPDSQFTPSPVEIEKSFTDKNAEELIDLVLKKIKEREIQKEKELNAKPAGSFKQDIEKYSKKKGIVKKPKEVIKQKVSTERKNSIKDNVNSKGNN